MDDNQNPTQPTDMPGAGTPAPSGMPAGDMPEEHHDTPATPEAPQEPEMPADHHDDQGGQPQTS